MSPKDGAAIDLPETSCPNCGSTLNRATSLMGDHTPSDGDVTICLRCGHIMIFENDRPRNPTDAEMREIAGDPRIIAAQKLRGKIVKR